MKGRVGCVHPAPAAVLQKELVQNRRVLDPDAGLVNCDSLGSGMQDSVLRISLLESSLHTLKLEKWTLQGFLVWPQEVTGDVAVFLLLLGARMKSHRPTWQAM